jgi:uncharacterized membrane protein YeiB
MEPPACAAAPSASPAANAERMAVLDVLRGAALLGILLMNAQSFAMPSPAYGNPAGPTTRSAAC